MKKLLSILLAAFMLTVPVFSAEFKDIEGHWAENEIVKLSNADIVRGSEGYFRPDDKITRGELAVILDRVLKLDTEAENIFTDLDNGFYKSALLKCAHSGIMQGFENKIRPNDNVTRQETAVMLGRAFGIAQSENGNTVFDDGAEVSGWAKGYINSFVNLGYINGADNKIMPEKGITRAEVVKLLDKCMSIEAEKPEEMPTQSPEAVQTPAPTPEITPQPTPSPTPTPEPQGSTEQTPGESEDVPTPSAPAPEITVGIKEGMVIKSRKKCFDVWARDYKGNKTDSSASLNGSPLEVAWNDTEKTSYNIEFTDENEGENSIEITAKDEEGAVTTVKYTVVYEPAQPGDVIGKAVWAVECFSIGNGYLVPPCEIDIIEGENSAKTLDRILKAAGYELEITGSLDKAFYLAAVLDGANKVNNTANTPQLLADKVKETLGSYDAQEVTAGRLGEFDFSQGSGWMYSVNNVFPNVGFADTYLSDGDVVRVQFTLCYGMDVGGSSALGSSGAENFFESPSRDEVTKLAARRGIENCPKEFVDIITKIDAGADEIKAAAALPE